MEKEKSNRFLLQLFIYIYFYKSCTKICKILKSQTADMVSDY